MGDPYEFSANKEAKEKRQWVIHMDSARCAGLCSSLESLAS